MLSSRNISAPAARDDRYRVAPRRPHRPAPPIWASSRCTDSPNGLRRRGFNCASAWQAAPWLAGLRFYAVPTYDAEFGEYLRRSGRTKMAELACSRGWDRPDRDEPHRHDPRSRNRVRSVQPHNGLPCALCWASFFPIRYSAAILPEPTPEFVSATRALLSKSRAALTVSTVSRPAAISRATNARVAESQARRCVGQQKR